ncbi:MAG TPA: hypothetical protein PLQ75_09735, partial [Anaerolineales bacterium]|nr:hypothetical protein [Anaerolineales bacterium]
MADIQQLLKLLQSNKPDKRFEACEELRAKPSLPPEAIDAFYPLTIDENQDVADAAQRAISTHAHQHPQSPLEDASLVPVRKTTVTDYAVG